MVAQYKQSPTGRHKSMGLVVVLVLPVSHTARCGFQGTQVPLNIGDTMSKERFDYRHPVFYSRKHPLYADGLDYDTRMELVRNLNYDQPPF